MAVPAAFVALDARADRVDVLGPVPGFRWVEQVHELGRCGGDGVAVGHYDIFWPSQVYLYIFTYQFYIAKLSPSFGLSLTELALF